MVKITNGVNVFEVTKGAYDGIYSRQGYTLVKEKKEKTKEIEEEKSETESNDYVSTLLEKPISSWTKDDVKRFAEIKGVDITGTKSVNEAKERIKAFINK